MSHPLVRDLSRPEAYPAEPARVKKIETHISWVFLTGNWVYKVKKPVKYSFLDFSTLEKRRHFCTREVELNRRLSPSLYKGVVPIPRDKQGLHKVEGKGEAVEYAVKLKQMPASTKMDVVIEQGRLKGKDVAEVARTLAGFHKKAERVEDLSFGQEPHLREVFNDISSVREVFEKELGQGAEVDALTQKSDVFLKGAVALLEKRIQGGFLRDCHGDVHAGNVFLAKKPLIFDCIEFNDAFRFTDTAGDVGFMAMDLDYRKKQRLTEHFIETYTEAARDRKILSVLPWYQAYRANVRAKVAALTLLHIASEKQRLEKLEEAEKYLALSRLYLDRL